jgi:hypothetical protein
MSNAQCPMNKEGKRKESQNKKQGQPISELSSTGIEITLSTARPTEQCVVSRVIF